MPFKPATVNFGQSRRRRCLLPAMKMYLPPPGGKPSRRGVLQKGLFGGVLLALGGGGAVALRKSVDVPVPTEGLAAVSPREFAVLVVLAQRLLPKRAGFPTVDELGVALACDRVIAQVDPSSRAELKQLLGLFENALTNLLLHARPTPFTRMDEDDQDATLDGWRHSALALRRTGYVALRTLIFAAYFGNPKSWAAVNYPGPPAGLHDPNAPAWRGGAPRPKPVQAPVPDTDAGVPDAGVEAHP